VATTLSSAHVALGRAIRELRLAGPERLSQEALAARAGIHRNYLGAVERGERNIAYTNLLKIAAALRLPASDLIRRAELKMKQR
jgi:transcriptional regulator with XRE-family HTH domain